MGVNVLYGVCCMKQTYWPLYIHQSRTFNLRWSYLCGRNCDLRPYIVYQTFMVMGQHRRWDDACHLFLGGHIYTASDPVIGSHSLEEHFHLHRIVITKDRWIISYIYQHKVGSMGMKKGAVFGVVEIRKYCTIILPCTV